MDTHRRHHHSEVNISDYSRRTRKKESVHSVPVPLGWTMVHTAYPHKHHYYHGYRLRIMNTSLVSLSQTSYTYVTLRYRDPRPHRHSRHGHRVRGDDVVIITIRFMSVSLVPPPQVSYRYLFRCH